MPITPENGLSGLVIKSIIGKEPMSARVLSGVSRTGPNVVFTPVGKDGYQMSQYSQTSKEPQIAADMDTQQNEQGLVGAGVRVRAGVDEDTNWRKANDSNPNGACVEIGTNEQLRLIRDSKNPNGGVLSLSPQALKSFLKSIQRGKFSN